MCSITVYDKTRIVTQTMIHISTYAERARMLDHSNANRIFQGTIHIRYHKDLPVRNPVIFKVMNLLAVVVHNRLIKFIQVHVFLGHAARSEKC